MARRPNPSLWVWGRVGRRGLSERTGGNMMKLEKHENVTEERIDRANSSAVPMGAGAAPTVGRYVRDHRNGGSARASAPDGRPFGVILRFEDLRATPPNIKRI